MSKALCLDLGGTNLRAGLVDAASPGRPQPLDHRPAPADLKAFRAHIGSLMERYPVSRIGIAVPGLAAGTRCIWIPNLPYLDGVDLANLFPGIGVALGNDAQMALLAETAIGAAQGRSDAILVAIGTGIGSAVLSDGRIIRGPSSSAASFGWAVADLNDRGDPVHGWLERAASGRVLDAIAHAAGLASGMELVNQARHGNSDALRLLMKPAAALGTTLAGAVALLGSRTIIVSGGVAESLDVLGPLVLDALRRHLPPHLRGIEIITGTFGSSASLVGAGLAALGNPLWKETPS
jgi:glucokinase